MLLTGRGVTEFVNVTEIKVVLVVAEYVNRVEAVCIALWLLCYKRTAGRQ